MRDRRECPVGSKPTKPQRESTRREGGFHFEKGVPVGGTARGGFPEQHVGIAGSLPVGACPQEGKPQKWVEPVQRQQSAEQGVERQIAPADVGKFMAQYQVGLFVGESFAKPRV